MDNPTTAEERDYEDKMNRAMRIQHVTAELTTRCGAKRTIETTYPPPPEIWIALPPLRHHYATHDIVDVGSAVERRRFVLNAGQDRFALHLYRYSEDGL